MEIGQQGIHQFERITGVDKNIRLPGHRLYLATGGDTFQASYAGGSDRNNPTAPGASLPHLLTDFSRDLDHLRMHSVIVNIVNPHRLKGARSHMQRDKGKIHPLCAKLVEQRLIKVQPRRGRGYCTGLFSVHRLIALPVSRVIGAINVGRQRHMAVAFKDIQRRSVTEKKQLEQIAIATFHLGLRTSLKLKPGARLW